MRRPTIILGLALLGLTISSCAPSGPSTLEIIDTLETRARDRDLEGMMALFAQDAVIDESFKREGDVFIFIGEEEILQ
jgi:hypothetical protein